MGEKLNYWLQKPIWVYSFGLFFLIYKSAEFFPSFQLSVFLLLLSGYCLITFLILFFVRITKLDRHIKYMHFWVMMSWALLLGLNYLNLIIETLNRLGLPHIKIWYFLIIFVLIIILLERFQFSILVISNVNKFINIFIVIFIGLIIIKGVTLWQKEKSHDRWLQNFNTPSIPNPHQRDVVWILMDEYAAPASLRTEFHFHDCLVDSLQKKGFYVFDSLSSRRDVTLYSINSLFNLDDSVPVASYPSAAYQLAQSKWLHQLKNYGYTFSNLDFFNIGSSLKFSYLSIFSDNYTDQILGDMQFFSLWNDICGKSSLDVFDEYNQKIIHQFPVTIHSSTNDSRFIWIHLLIPHFPTCRNADGSLNPNFIFDPSLSLFAEVSRQYINYLSYGNKVALNMLSQVPDWQHKIIVISGDHGARMHLKDGDPRRFATFAAIYYPGMDTTELKKIKYLQQIPFHLH